MDRNTPRKSRPMPPLVAAACGSVAQRSLGNPATSVMTKKMRKLRESTADVWLETWPTRNSPEAVGAAAEMFAMRRPLYWLGGVGRKPAPPRFTCRIGCQREVEAARHRLAAAFTSGRG